MLRCAFPHVNGAGIWCVAFCLLAYAASLLMGRTLSADGAYYLAMVTDTRDFFLVGWNRAHAQILTQILPVFAARVALLGPEALHGLYALNLLGMAVLATGVLLRWLPRSEIAILPALSFVMIQLNGSAIIMGEFSVLVLLVWPVLAFLLFPQSRIFDRAICLVICVILVRCYEAAVVVLFVPLVLAVWRLRLAAARRDRLFYAVMALLLLAGVAVGVDGIVSPRDPGNFNAFRAQALTALGSEFVPAALVMAAGMFLSGWTGRNRWAVFALMAALVTGGISIWIFGQRTALESFSARTLTIWAVPGLMVMTTALILRRSTMTWQRPAIWSALGFCFVGAVYSVWLDTGWLQTTEAMRQAAATQRGFVPFPPTGVDPIQIASPYALSTLGILLDDRCVQAIFLPPEMQWVPFDPRSQKILTDFRDYGAAVGGMGC